MIDEILYLREEAEQKRKIDAIQQTMQEYIQTNPEITVFRFFLPSHQDIDVIRQAAATTSLSIGKRIELIYPGSVTRKEEKEDGYASPLLAER